MSHIKPPDVRPSPLSRVPTEIKSLIAALAAQQDQAYKQRVTTRWFGGIDGEVVEGGARPWHGRSVNALFCLSREWNALAAPYVFKTISSERCGESIFMVRIAHRYAAFVEEAVFSDDEADKDGPRQLLTLLCIFSNLRRVSIHLDIFLHLLGIGAAHQSYPTADQRVHGTALLEIVNKGSELSLLQVDLPQLSWILPRLGGVKHLDIVCNPSIYDEEGHRMRSASTFLRGVPDLEHFSIRGLDPHSVSLIKSPDTSWAFGATLRSLEVGLYGAKVSTSVWHFVCTFSTTLEKLVLEADNEELSEGLERRAEGGKKKKSFPALRHVTFKGGPQVAIVLLLLVASSPLHTVTLAPDDWTPQTLLSLLQHLIDHFSASLQHVELQPSYNYRSRGFVTPSTLADLTSLSSLHRLSISVGPRDDAFFRPADRATPSSLPATCAAADETLKFGLAHSARLLETEDFEGARALLHLLAPLKGEMLREKD